MPRAQISGLLGELGGLVTTSPAQEEVAKQNMIFSLRQFDRRFQKVATDVSCLRAAAEEQGLDDRHVPSHKSRPPPWMYFFGSIIKGNHFLVCV